MSLAGRWMRRDRMSAWTRRQLTVRPTERLFRLVLESHPGRALAPIPKRSASPRATSTLTAVDSLKALDPNRPIREADMCGATRDVCFGPKADMHLMEHPAHSPCSRNQMNGPVTFYRETGTYTVTQCDTPLLGKRHTVARRWCLPAKKWRPVIFKVPENRWDID
jgi:hypothetical protein